LHLDENIILPLESVTYVPGLKCYLCPDCTLSLPLANREGTFSERGAALPLPPALLCIFMRLEAEFCQNGACLSTYCPNDFVTYVPGQFCYQCARFCAQRPIPLSLPLANREGTFSERGAAPSFNLCFVLFSCFRRGKHCQNDCCFKKIIYPGLMVITTSFFE
jgi:hypothetical protein